MDSEIQQQQQTAGASEPSVLLVAIGNVAELTLGEGGTGSESKRYEYN
jgi:hypothetical protein